MSTYEDGAGRGEGWFADSDLLDLVHPVDAESVVVQTLRALALRGEIKPEIVSEAFAKYRIDDPTAVADVAQEGGDA